MKTKLLAATGFAAILFIAYFVLFSNKNKTKNLLAGKYEIINITDSSTTKQWVPGDTLKRSFNSLKDSSRLYVNFENDSLIIFKTNADVDSIKYYSDNVNKTVYVKTDSIYHPCKIIQQSDSLVNFFATQDSVYVLLKKG